jgi:integration host factor subunit beta
MGVCKNSRRRSMNKSDLIEIVAQRLDLPNSGAYRAVDAVFDAITQALVRGERVEIRGVGSWMARQYRAKDARNPRTGEHIRVPSKRSPYFKAGKDLSERIMNAWHRDQDNL